MKNFEEYYGDDKIIKYLCKIRIKYAKKRHKKHLLDKLTHVKHYLPENDNPYDLKIITELDEILPKRRLWLTHGKNSLKKNATGETVKLDTDKKNVEILYTTINWYRKYKPSENFIVNLNRFIAEIQTSIDNTTYKINPNEWDIVPEIKETNNSKKKLELKHKKNNECRPISRFGLKDRIVLSITNKFLTELFDEFFEDSAVAFRAKKLSETERKNHHTAIKRIIEYKTNNIDKNPFVAECDMKKFYDTVNHKKCLKAFYQLIGKASQKYPNINSDKSIHIFEEYLDFYSFNNNVWTKNGDKSYWDKQLDKNRKKINGFFPWTDKEINSHEYYKRHDSDRIGVPQGGALSGLIANIILDQADKKLNHIDGLFYVRYCDDMILMHVEENKCKDAIDLYKKELDQLLLFSHPFKNQFIKSNKSFIDNKTGEKREFKTKQSQQLKRSYQNSMKPFWTQKSKGPYTWGCIDVENKVFPWIAFVGYEVSYKCEVRVRKKSLRKEIDKQEKVVGSILKIISKSKKARNNTIYKSAAEKLNGMSVGRIKLHNYQTCKNENSWTHGFQCLNLNPHSKAQLRKLDKNKYGVLKYLEENLGEDVDNDGKKTDNSEILKYHKPFSYYYQAGEKKAK